MLGYNEAALEGPDAPAFLRNNYSLWRLMIDKRYQKQGFGREAVRLALEFVRTWPHVRHPLQSRKRGGKEAVRFLRLRGER